MQTSEAGRSSVLIQLAVAASRGDKEVHRLPVYTVFSLVISSESPAVVPASCDRNQAATKQNETGSH